MSEPSNLRAVVTLYETNSRDISAMLRKLADDIEADRYGEAREVACVMLADQLEVFGWGPNQDGGSTHLLLTAGAHKMIAPILREGL